MKLTSLLAASVAILGIAFAPVAYAISPMVVAAIVKVGHQLADMGDGSDTRSVIIVISGAPCGKPRHEHSPRSTQIAQKYRVLRDAGDSGDADALLAAAVELKRTVDRSSMFQQCFNAMKNSSKVMSQVMEIIDTSKQQ